jgi:universal stress protein A
MKYKHVLLATDLMDDCQVVAKRAAETAKQNDAKLSIVHVVEPLPGYGYAFISPSDIETQLLDEAKKQIKVLGKKYQVPEDQQRVEMGPTKIEIADYANDNKVDLIVVGTHTRHGFGHFIGSTANAVIHEAECDVLTVRIPDPK